MKFIQRILALIIVLFIGYWLGSSDILANTYVGNVLDTLSTWVDQGIERGSNLLNGEDERQVSTIDESIQLANKSHKENDDPFDYHLIHDRTLDLLNQLRTEKGLSPVQTDPLLTEAALVRAEESAENFSHTRPDGRDAFTIFNDGIDYNYRYVGENLGKATYALPDQEMADLIFNGWVESPGHYENMVRPEFEEIGIGLYYDSEFLYAAQIFAQPAPQPSFLNDSD